ncbi:MAG: O-antigen/teichoic acid export membrane protein [Planctomycetota bacterium]
MKLIPRFIHRRIAHRPGLFKIVENIGWLFFDKILRMGVGLFIGVWIARYLGPEQFGLLSFATAFVGLFGAIAGLGLKSIVVRDIVRDPACKEEILGTAAALQIIGGLLSYGLIIGTIFWLRPDDVLAKVLVAILGSMMLFKASEVAIDWFQSQVLSKYTVWVQNGSFLIFAAIKVGLILNHAPLTAFAWAMMAEALVVALLMLVMLSLFGPRLRQLRITLVRARTLLKDCWPLIISSISIVIYMKIDQIMLGQMINDEAVGIYSVAARISEAWYFLAIIINESIRPSLIRIRVQSSELFLYRLQKVFNLMVQLSFSVALVMTFFSPMIISLLFGEDYNESIGVLQIHVWAGVFVFLNNAVWAWYIIENKQKIANIRIIIGLSLNILLNWILIPKYGAIGAAIATLVSRAFVSYFGLLLSKKTSHLFMMMTYALLTLGIRSHASKISS